MTAASVDITLSEFARPFSSTCSSGTAHLGHVPDEFLSKDDKTFVVHLGGHIASAVDVAWFWDSLWQAGEREADKDIASRSGDYFDNSEDFLASL